MSNLPEPLKSTLAEEAKKYSASRLSEKQIEHKRAYGRLHGDDASFESACEEGFFDGATALWALLTKAPSGEHAAEPAFIKWRASEGRPVVPDSEMSLDERFFGAGYRFGKEGAQKEFAPLRAEHAAGLDKISKSNLFNLADSIATQRSLDAARAELVRLRRVLEGYANLPDGQYYGPDDLYPDLGATAREALAKLEAIRGK